MTALVAAPFFKLSFSTGEWLGSLLVIVGIMGFSLVSKLARKKNIKNSIPAGVTFSQEAAPQLFDSVLILLRDASNWILVRNHQRNGWEFPGGHRENAESFEDTAKRECMEEAGVQIDGIRYLGYYELRDKCNHRTIVVTAQVSDWSTIPPGFETSHREVFSEFPEDLTFKDGLYHFLIEKLHTAKSSR